jgi:hypothetical protein
MCRVVAAERKARRGRCTMAPGYVQEELIDRYSRGFQCCHSGTRIRSMVYMRYGPPGRQARAAELEADCGRVPRQQPEARLTRSQNG